MEVNKMELNNTFDSLRSLSITGVFLLITSFGFCFAAQVDERKEGNPSVVLAVPEQRIIIPTQYKNAEISRNCFKRLMQRIEKTDAYKLFDKKIAKNADKLIVQNAKGIMVAGLAGMQMLISNYEAGSVVYTVEQEMGNGLAQYGIHKKINPKLLIMILMGLSFFVQWLCTFDTYGQVDIPPSDFNNSTGIFNGTMGNITSSYPDPEAYNTVLNNCLIDLYYLVNGPDDGTPTLTSNYTVGAYNNAVNNCLNNINVIINGIPNPENDPWLFLTDFQYSFLISVVYTATYILQELGKSKRTIKSQTDVNCMQTQIGDNINEEDLDDLTLDNNIAGRLTYKPLKEVNNVDIGCMTNEDDVSASAGTTENHSGSSAASPNVTSEKVRPTWPTNSSPSSFRLFVAKGTQVPNESNKSLSQYANMQTHDEEAADKILSGKNRDHENALDFNLALDVD
jgi:hypothetical protein